MAVQLGDVAFYTGPPVLGAPDDLHAVIVEFLTAADAKTFGRANDRLLSEQEDRLRGWLAKRGIKAGGEPEYAFYNSPMIPGPLRRNEVWLALS